jgi:hypothetical protein
MNRKSSGYKSSLQSNLRFLQERTSKKMSVVMDKDNAETPRARRFALLRHSVYGNPDRADHYDLVLELRWGHDCEAKELLAFATVEDKLPLGEGELLAPLETHRRFYLFYEGPLPGATRRGIVQRVDEGTVEFIHGMDETSIERIQSLTFTLSGRILNGRFILHREARGNEMFFSFHRLTGWLEKPGPNP